MDAKSMDFKWFVKNHDKLYRQYPHKHIVIKEKNVVYAGDTFEDALTNAVAMGLKPGEFIIQECSEGEESYTQTFSSRVIFA